MIINKKSYRKDCVTHAMFISMFVITIIHVWTFIWVWNCEVQPLQNSELLGYTKYVDVWCTWACDYWPIASKDSKLFMIFYGRPCILITRNQGNGDDPQAFSLRAFSSCIWNQQVTYGYRKRYVKFWWCYLLGKERQKFEGVPFSSLLESELKSFDRLTLLRIIFEK